MSDAVSGWESVKIREHMILAAIIPTPLPISFSSASMTRASRSGTTSCNVVLVVLDVIRQFVIIAERLDLRLFAQPDRTISPSVYAIADQAVDASHLDMIRIVTDRAERYRCPDLLD